MRLYNQKEGSHTRPSWNGQVTLKANLNPVATNMVGHFQSFSKSLVTRLQDP